MDWMMFFAGAQAFAAFTQVWQAERNITDAKKVYFETKEKALVDPKLRSKVATLEGRLQNKKRFANLFQNKMEQCEDKLERAMRDEDEHEKLDAVSRDYRRCKCNVLLAVKTAQGGSLVDELLDEWDELGCEAFFGLQGGKRP